MSTHAERHLRSSATIRDVVIGLADGLTVPFALAAGVSAAVASTRIIVTAGFAEIIAGALAMGLGGYLAARTDAEHYDTEYRREQLEVEHKADVERDEVREIFEGYGVSGSALDEVVRAVSSEPRRWVDFMMRFELGLEKPDATRAPQSALTIGASYAVGGFIPLLPYLLSPNVHSALLASSLLTLLALFVFGGIKSRMTGVPWVRGAVQTASIGAIAAGAAFGLAHLVSSS